MGLVKGLPNEWFIVDVFSISPKDRPICQVLYFAQGLHWLGLLASFFSSNFKISILNDLNLASQGKLHQNPKTIWLELQNCLDIPVGISHVELQIIKKTLKVVRWKLATKRSQMTITKPKQMPYILMLLTYQTVIVSHPILTISTIN